MAPMNGKAKARRSGGKLSAAARKVEICAGAGMPHEEIAAALGISVSELVAEFEAELATGAYQRRMENLCALYKSAQDGSVNAQKAYANGAPQLMVPKPKEDDAKEAKPAKLGKKEQAKEDAVTAAEGSDWADLLPSHGGTLQ